MPIGEMDLNGKQWHMALGTTAGLFDIAVGAFIASSDPKNRDAVADALSTLRVETPVGQVEWGKGPVPPVVVTPFLNGQWIKGEGKYPFDWVCVENAQDSSVPVGAS